MRTLHVLQHSLIGESSLKKIGHIWIACSKFAFRKYFVSEHNRQRSNGQMMMKRGFDMQIAVNYNQTTLTHTVETSANWFGPHKNVNRWCTGICRSHNPNDCPPFYIYIPVVWRMRRTLTAMGFGICALSLPLSLNFFLNSNVQCDDRLVCLTPCRIRHCIINYKSKVMPWQTWIVSESSRWLILPDFKTIGTWRW